jgi:phthalate 4,5-cis-dihydrodiol dehydrogenase
MQMLPSLMAHPRIRIAACTDLNLEARDRFATDFEATAYENAEALCDDPSIDAVYIATPHKFHREHTVMAAEASKHIIVEKPMALTLEDCDAMIEATEKNKIFTVVGHTHSFNAPVMKMREIVRSGELGGLTLINSFSYGNFMYRPRRPEELDTALGGGIIFNQVPHQMDVVRLLGGGMIRSIRAMSWKLDSNRPTEGSHATFVQFDSGAAATIVFSGNDYFDSDEFHGWVGELGEQREANTQGSARRALVEAATNGIDEAALKGSRAYAGKPDIKAPVTHPHCGITIVSCEGGDMRPSPAGLTIFGRDGRREIPVPPTGAFPDKSGVIGELWEAVTNNREPTRNARWGKATMEASLAVLESTRESRDIILRHQVPVAD